MIETVLSENLIQPVSEVPQAHMHRATTLAEPRRTPAEPRRTL